MICDACILSCLLLFSILLDLAENKGGAKMRAKRPNTNEKNGRFNSIGPQSGSSHSMDDHINSLVSYTNRNASHEELLLQYLFHNYDPVARAVMDTDRPVMVSIDFVLLRIHGLDERSQVLTTTGLIIAEWKDDRLTWVPEMFGGLKDIILKSEQIWLPELAVMNGVEELVPDFERIRVLLDFEGRLHWEPGGIFRTTCDIDIAYFPFDAQHCPLLIGAYSYYSTKMNITNARTTVSTHDYRLNGEWHVHKTSATWAITVLDCCPGAGYTHVVFALHLKRRYKFYVMNIVLPCVMLSMLIMVGFFLPPEAGEKISLGVSVLLAFTVFLLMIADNIPRTSLAIPLIVIYLMATMTLGTISICMTVIVLNMHHRGRRYRIPKWVRKTILSYVARLVCIETTCRNEEQSDGQSIWLRRPPKNDKRLAKDVTEMDDLTITTQCQPTSCHENGSTKTKGKTSKRYAHNRGLNTTVNPFMERWHLDEGAIMSEDCRTKEWQELARVLDRLFFWIIFIFMTASAMVILFYPNYAGMQDDW